MTLIIKSKDIRNLKSKFYYNQLLDLLFPLLLTFAISIIFINFIGSKRDMVLTGRDQSIIVIGASISFLFVGYIIKSIELLFKSEQKLIIDEELQTIQINGKSFDRGSAKISYKPVEYRPVKLLHIFAKDTDLMRVSLEDSNKIVVIDIEKRLFEKLSENIEIFKNAELKNIAKPFSVMSFIAVLLFTVGYAILTCFLLVYFLVR